MRNSPREPSNQATGYPHVPSTEYKFSSGIHTFIIKQKMEYKGSESNGSDKSNPEVSLIFKGHWTQPQSTSTDPDVSSGTNPFNPR